MTFLTWRNNVPVCLNPACCPSPSCHLQHLPSVQPGSVTRLRLCRYRTLCSDVLCGFYHPDGKTRYPCKRWADCTNPYCELLHAHKLRPPACSRGKHCKLPSCRSRMLHPATNEGLFCTPLWRVFTQMSHIIEEFLTFKECRYVSLVCIDFNHLFSTNPERINRQYGLHKKAVVVDVKRLGYAVARGPLSVPFQHVELQSENRFTAVSVKPNIQRARLQFWWFGLISTTRQFRDTVSLRKAFEAPSEECFAVVECYEDSLVIEHPKGVSIEWQTKAFLSSVSQVDVCSCYGVWFTCDVLSVQEDIVTVEFPWWYGVNVVRKSRQAYPSAYIAPAGTQAYDWRNKLKKGSRVVYSENLAMDSRVEVKVREIRGERCIVVDVRPDGETMFEVPLGDGVHGSLGPLLSYYISTNAQLQLRNLDYSDTTCRTRVTFSHENRNKLPTVCKVSYYD